MTTMGMACINVDSSADSKMLELSAFKISVSTPVSVPLSLPPSTPISTLLLYRQVSVMMVC